jgi:hypothetical protein
VARQTYASIVHRGIVDIDVLDDVVLARILSERSNRYPMGAITKHVLDQEIGAIGFESDAICIRSVSWQQIQVHFNSPSPLFTCEFWIVRSELRYVSQPSVFFATFLLTLSPAMLILSKITLVELATK